MPPKVLLYILLFMQGLNAFAGQRHYVLSHKLKGLDITLVLDDSDSTYIITGTEHTDGSCIVLEMSFEHGKYMTNGNKLLLYDSLWHVKTCLVRRGKKNYIVSSSYKMFEGCIFSFFDEYKVTNSGDYYIHMRKRDSAVFHNQNNKRQEVNRMIVTDTGYVPVHSVTYENVHPFMFDNDKFKKLVIRISDDSTFIFSHNKLILMNGTCKRTDKYIYFKSSLSDDVYVCEIINQNQIATIYFPMFIRQEYFNVL